MLRRLRQAGNVCLRCMERHRYLQFICTHRICENGVNTRTSLWKPGVGMYEKNKKCTRHTEYVVGVDVGATHIRCAMVHNRAKSDPPALIEYWETPSNGWVNGRVADSEAVRASINRAFSRPKLASIYIRGKPGFVFGVGGPLVAGVAVTSNFATESSRWYTDELLAEVVSLACGESNTGQRTLSLASQRLRADGILFESSRDVNAKVRHLEYSAYRVTAPAVNVEELEETLPTFLTKDQRMLLASEALAASFAVLTPQERQDGAIVVDIGAQGSGMVIWKHGSVLKVCGLLAGGDLFTRDGAYCMGSSFEESEERKLKDGLLFPDRDRRDARSGPFQMALLARAERLAESIKVELRHASDCSSTELESPRPLILVGGGALLRGLPRYLESRLGHSVTVGSPDRLFSEGNKIAVSSPFQSIAVGLASCPYWLHPWEIDKEQEKWDSLLRLYHPRVALDNKIGEGGFLEQDSDLTHSDPDWRDQKSKPQ